MDRRTQYDQEMTKRYSIKLNKKTDAKLIAYLEQQKSIQGAIKNALSNALPQTPLSFSHRTFQEIFSLGCNVVMIKTMNKEDRMLTKSDFMPGGEYEAYLEKEIVLFCEHNRCSCYFGI